jgi:hypothetical protein
MNATSRFELQIYLLIVYKNKSTRASSAEVSATAKVPPPGRFGARGPGFEPGLIPDARNLLGSNPLSTSLAV